jgi:hypothetical protein
MFPLQSLDALRQVLLLPPGEISQDRVGADAQEEHPDGGLCSAAGERHGEDEEHEDEEENLHNREPGSRIFRGTGRRILARNGPAVSGFQRKANAGSLRLG